MIPKDLWNRRIIVVTGKGGVGKSTVSAALGIAAARAGKRACVVEMNGQGRVASVFGLSHRAYAARNVAPGVDTLSLTVAECLDDFGRTKLKMDTLVWMLLSTRVVGAFIDAVPGLHDLLQLGKIEHMADEPVDDEPKYDVLVVDAPSTGHGLSLMQAARTMSDLVRVGRFHDLADAVGRTFADPLRTAMVVVTLPEDLPVNETLELIGALGDDRPLVAGVIANRFHGSVVPVGGPWEAMRDALASAPDPDLRQLGLLATKEMERQAYEQTAVERLRHELGRTPVAVLPWVAGQEGEMDLVRLACALVEEVA